MCALTFAALLGLATGCVQVAPADPLAPADPRIEARFRPPPSPLSGLKTYQPVEARTDWGSASPPSPQGGNANGTMPGMPGMDMGGTR